MGKSTVGRMLSGYGLPVADADAIAREVVEPGQICLEQIVKEFGVSILQQDGQLNRSALAEVVFSDSQRRAALEAILHPRIRAEWQEAVRRWEENQSPAGVVIIPLLHETQAASFFDRVLCVACCRESQLERLQRRGWSAEEIKARVAAQWSLGQKAEASDFFIWTDASVQCVEEQVRRILGVLLPGIRKQAVFDLQCAVNR